MHRLFIAAALFLIALSALAAEISKQFVKAQLAHGASIDIPRSWQIMRGNESIAIESTVGAAIDLTGNAKVTEGTELLLISIFPDPGLYAGVTVTSTAIPNASRSSVGTLTDAQVKAGESAIRQGIVAMLSRLGERVSGWTPLEKVSLGGRIVLHISYVRSSEVGDRRVQMYKIFGSGRIYDLALSTSLAHENTNQIILSRIATSFTVQ